MRKFQSCRFSRVIFGSLPLRIHSLCPKTNVVMADTKAKMPSATSSKSKRQAKNAAAEDPWAAAQVRAILDPEQSDLVTAKMEEIQLTGAAVTLSARADG